MTFLGTRHGGRPRVAQGRRWATRCLALLALVLVPLVAHAGNENESGALPAAVDDPAVIDLPAKQSRVGKAPLVTVHALGPVTREQLRIACRSVLQAYPVRCAIGSSRKTASFRSAWNAEREQMDARRLLEVMFDQRNEGGNDVASIELLVTSYDIYQTGKPYVFGLASLTDRLAVVSTARIKHEQRDAVERRLRKLVLHEIGHTFGLTHSVDRRCVMRTDADVHSLDSAPERMCLVNQRQATLTAEALRRDGAQALDRVRGLLARGEHAAARERIDAALVTTPPHPEVLAEMAAALVSVGDLAPAFPLLQRALDLDPESAAAHATLGIALQMRNGPGDRRRAIGALRRAVELEPSWSAARDHLRRLEDKGARANAQGPDPQ